MRTGLAAEYQLVFGGKPTRRPMPMQSASILSPAAWIPWMASSSSRSSIAGHPDRANDFAVRIADQHAAAFGKDLLAARGNEIAHEDRSFPRALADEFRAAP